MPLLRRSEQFIVPMQTLLRHFRAGETVRLRAERTACKIMNRDYLTIPTCSLKPLSIIARSEGLRFFCVAADTCFNDITSTTLLPIPGWAAVSLNLRFILSFCNLEIYEQYVMGLIYFENSLVVCCFFHFLIENVGDWKSSESVISIHFFLFLSFYHMHLNSV